MSIIISHIGTTGSSNIVDVILLSSSSTTILLLITLIISILLLFQLLIIIVVVRYINYIFITNPLRYKIPWGPKDKKDISFLFGSFNTIRKEPFMSPHKRWIKEAYEKEEEKEKAILFTTSTTSTATLTATSVADDGNNNNDAVNNQKKTSSSTDASIIPHRHIHIPMLYYTSFFGKPNIVVLDKNIVKDILTSSPVSTSNRNNNNKVRYTTNRSLLSNRIGNGLVTLEGNMWKKHRFIISPAFRPHVLKNDILIKSSVINKIHKFITYWYKLSTIHHEINLSTHLSSLTLDIIGDVAFSHDFYALDSIKKYVDNVVLLLEEKQESQGQDDDQQKEEKVIAHDDILINSITKLFKFTRIGTIMFLIGSTTLDYYFNYHTVPLRKIIDKYVDEIIQNAKNKNKISSSNDESNSKSSSSSSSSLSSSSPSSLLQLLLQARDDTNGEEQQHKNQAKYATKKNSNNNNNNNNNNTLNDKELRDEVKTFMFAGHDTTSTLLYWSIYVLCIYPDIQDKVYNDIIKTLQDESESSSSSSKFDSSSIIDDIDLIENSMIYFNAFINEVLRLYPPIGMLIRYNTNEEVYNISTTTTTTSNDDSSNKIKIPCNTRFIISPHLLHRSTKYFGIDADIFKPERWIFNNNPTDYEQYMNTIRFAYIPFSAGPRNCIGKRFALIEAKLILVNLIKKFKFQIAPSQRNTKFTFTNFIATKTKPSVKIILHNRD